MSAEFDAALILATILGPVLAVQAQKRIEAARAPRERRVEVFKTLMATRAAGLSPRHVEALNMISLEFPGEKFSRVRDAWRTYLDHLSTPLPSGADPSVWAEKRSELLTKLLSAMASVLGYQFDEVDIRKGAYVPQQHVNDEQEQRALRSALLQLLAGKAVIKTEITALPDRPMTVIARPGQP